MPWYYHGISDSDDDDEGLDDVPFGTFRGEIVGIRYYRGTVNNREMVSLNREPNNQYDRNAIRVDNVFRVQVGHIKRQQAAVLARIIDSKRARVEGYDYYYSHCSCIGVNLKSLCCLKICNVKNISKKNKRLKKLFSK